jgi:hypothetical protein
VFQSANSQSAHFQIIPNLTNYFTPQISGFAICGTFWRTARFCRLLNVRPKVSN